MKHEKTQKKPMRSKKSDHKKDKQTATSMPSKPKDETKE